MPNLGSAGWAVQSSAVATQTGAQISMPGFGTSTWLPVSNDDAGAPGTETEALAQNGKCPGGTALQPVNQGTSGPDSVFFASNMQNCYGYMNKVDADTVAQGSCALDWNGEHGSGGHQCGDEHLLGHRAEHLLFTPAAHTIAACPRPCPHPSWPEAR